MSATTSFANPEPPPLLFGSPPFSPRSPLHTQTPVSPPPIPIEEPEDVDMTTSITLPAQNHDRQDDAMEDGAEAAPEMVEETLRDGPGHTQVSGEQDFADDVMDTTPDPSPQPEAASTQQPQPPSDSQHTSHSNATFAPAAPANTNGDSSSQVLPASTIVAGTVNDTSIEVEEPQPPSDTAPSSMPPIAAEVVDDSSSVSSEEDFLRWIEITDDNSVPDEQELKEIESSTERSATDGKSQPQISTMQPQLTLHR